MSEITQTLDKIRALAKKAAEFEKDNAKENFDIFNCLTRHHLEELHTKFIAYLLDPKASHGFEGNFLKKFISLLPGHEISMGGDELFNNAKVIKEYSFFKDGRYRYIDIFIEIGGTYIAIENKVYAYEQYEQIKEYAEYCRSRNARSMTYYLTLDGKESNTSGDVSYSRISYKEHILSWLDSILNSKEGGKKFKTKYPSAFYHIKAYKDIVKNILNMAPDPLVDMLKTELRKKENLLIHGRVNAILQAVKELNNDIRNEVFREIIETLQEYNFNPVNHLTIPIQIDYIWQSARGGLRADAKDFVFAYMGNKEVHFCIEHNEENIYFGLSPYIRNNEGQYSHVNINQDRECAMIKELLPKQLRNVLVDDNEYWICYKYFNFNNLKFNSQILSEVLIENSSEVVRLLLKDIVEYLDSWKICINDLKGINYE